jgi:hypothetical protein
MCNGKHRDVGPASLLTDIQTLNNDYVLQDEKATKQASPEFDGLTSELEVSDLNLNEAL